jgi:hypothetical protein
MTCGSSMLAMIFSWAPWSVEGSELTVECSIARGAQTRFATVSIQDVVEMTDLSSNSLPTNGDGLIGHHL